MHYRGGGGGRTVKSPESATGGGLNLCNCGAIFSTALTVKKSFLFITGGK